MPSCDPISEPITLLASCQLDIVTEQVLLHRSGVAGKSVSHHHRHSAWQRGATAGIRRYRDDGDGLGDGGVRRYRGNRDGRSDGEYIFERPRGR